MAGPEAVSNRDLDGLQKAPPNSIEAEEALLGSALLSRDAANRLMESVKSLDFYSPTNQTTDQVSQGYQNMKLQNKGELQKSR